MLRIESSQILKLMGVVSVVLLKSKYLYICRAKWHHKMIIIIKYFRIAKYIERAQCVLELKPKKSKAPSFMQINHADCDASYAITLLWICPHNNAIFVSLALVLITLIEKGREKAIFTMHIWCEHVKKFSRLSNGIITPEEGKLRMTTLYRFKGFLISFCSLSLSLRHPFGSRCYEHFVVKLNDKNVIFLSLCIFIYIPAFCLFGAFFRLNIRNLNDCYGASPTRYLGSIDHFGRVTEFQPDSD